jgi:hypothetical protein
MSFSTVCFIIRAPPRFLSAAGFFVVMLFSSLLLAPAALEMVAAAVPPRGAAAPPATTPPARLERRDQVTLGATFQGYTLVTSADTTICAFLFRRVLFDKRGANWRRKGNRGSASAR